MQEFDEAKIKANLKIDARGIGIPSGAADVFIERALKDARKSLKQNSMITEKDFSRALAEELKKYHRDFAYVYQNRDTII